jgi:hypothetical protein
MAQPKGPLATNAFWKEALLGSGGDQCIYHCVLPFKMSSKLSTWDQAMQLIDVNSTKLVTALAASMLCVVCKADLGGTHAVCCGRVLVAKQPVSEATGRKAFIYRFGYGSAALCKPCMLHHLDYDEATNLLESDPRGMEYVFERLKDASLSVGKDCVYMDLTGPQILACILSRFQTQYLATLRHIGKIDAVCACCKKPGAKRICSGCMHYRYCDDVCSLNDWRSYHRQECADLAKGPLFMPAIDMEK